MSKQFTGKTAFVTGGGTGIGRAAALALAAEGATVTVAGRTARTLEDTVREIADAGGAARFAICDVADEDAVAAAVEVAVGETGRLDFAVNSAGIDGEGAAITTEYPMDKFDRMMATNVRGVFLSMKHELAQMQTQGFGSIINISSGAGLIGVPGFAAYSASKWAAARSPAAISAAIIATRSGRMSSVSFTPASCRASKPAARDPAPARPALYK